MNDNNNVNWQEIAQAFIVRDGCTYGSNTIKTWQSIFKAKYRIELPLPAIERAFYYLRTIGLATSAINNDETQDGKYLWLHTPRKRYARGA